ncbi:acyl-CoA reductase [Streptosporangium soli]|nr:gamma-glutamyl phosphate reductase [Streptosporangium sp. KLBMP 9127]
MIVESRFPAGPPVGVETMVTESRAEPPDGPLAVGDERVRGFLEAVARRLIAPNVARRHPELAALGFFLRRGEVSRALDRLRPDAENHLRVPRGLVFHIPPANVDTVFVYSWALSALVGNHNVVRLSPRSGAAALTVLDVLLDVLPDTHPAVAHSQRIVSYDRSGEVTARLSAACDLRVVWGGDSTVREVRRHPLPPHARDLTFPDRSSFAVISISAWLTAAEETRQRAIEGFANDAYWFGQAACASPRAIFWVGASHAEEAMADFTGRLAAVAASRWPVDAAMAVEKRVAAYGLAADGAVGRVAFHGNALTMLDLADPAGLPRRWLGAGTFAHARLGSLHDLLAVVRRKDQTMTHFGFAVPELQALARALAGRGVDRMVPFGSALSFNGVWDGTDLLAEFTRLVTIST